MKLLKKVFFIAFVISFYKGNAQSQTKQNNSNPNWEAAQNAGYNTPAINENDPYMGRTQEFLHIMTVTKLPADFPKYEKSLGLRYYNEVVDSYFRNHLDLLKDKWRQKLSGNK